MTSHLPFPSKPPALKARIAFSREELTGAFELVYRSYVAKRYIEPHPGGVVYQSTFGLPSSRTLVALSQAGEVLGTLTLVGDNPLGLQLEATYSAEVQSLRDEGRKLAEVTCLAAEPAAEIRPRAVFFALTEFALHYACWQQYDDLLLAIHPRHYRFYWHCFRVYPVGPCRPHGPVRGNPAVCCRIDMHHLQRNMLPRLWQQYFSRMRPKEHYAGSPITPSDHLYFCNRRAIALDADYSGRRVRRRYAG